MTLDQLTTQVYPGTHLVARSPGGILVVAPSRPAHETVTSRLLTLVAKASLTSGQQLLYQVVTEIGFTDVELVPTFCVVGSAASDLVLLAKGAVTVGVRPVDGDEERWSAAAEPTWVEHTIALPVDSVEVLVDERVPAARDQRLDLRTGVVGGGGVLLAPSGPLPEPGREPVIDLT